MGSKGSQTQTQTYQANPAIQQSGYQALGMAQNAANTPFSLPAAPVAGFTPDQLSAFQQTRDAQGMALPYFNTATNYAIQSGAPITEQDVANNYNPFAQNVFANMREGEGIQRRDITGKLTQAAGGVGADRIAVGQGELARQQGLAEGQTAAGMYQSALTAAQADKARQAQTAFALAQFGPAAQATQQAGSNALFGMGSQQQGLSQAQQMADYNLRLQQAGYPFQTAQYLASITGGLSGALGGTQTTTKNPPPLFNQILGAGVGGLGFAQNMGWLNGGSGSNGWGGYNAQSPPPWGMTADQDPSLIGARGGAVPGYADGGDVIAGSHSYVPDMPIQPSQPHRFSNPDSGQQQDSGGLGDILKIAGTVAKFAPMLAYRGGGVSAGGPVTPYQAFSGYVDGGDVDSPYEYNTPMTDPAAMNAWRSGVDADMGRGMTATDNASDPNAPALAFLPGEGGPQQPPYSPPSQPRLPPPSGPPSGGYSPYPLPYDINSRTDPARNQARSPGTALMNMGAAMAGTYASPFGALASGFKSYGDTTERQREASRHEEEVNLKADALMKDWQKHLDQYSKMTPYQQAEINMRKMALDKQLKQMELEGMKPFPLFDDPETGLTIRGVRDPSDPEGRKFKIIDPNSGRLVDEYKGIRASGPNGEPSAESKPPKPEDSPLGVPELATNLSPTKAKSPGMVKGPFATSEANNIKAIDAQMNKGRDAIEVQRDQINRLKMAYATVMKDGDKDNFFQRMMTIPGAADPATRIAAMRKLNAIAESAKKPLPFDPAKVAAMEEAQKIQYTMGTTFASTISPRDSQQMQLGAIAAQPGFIQSPQGFQRLIGLYDGISNHSQAMHDFWGRWRQANPRTTIGWEEDFRTKNPGEKYTVRALIENTPYQKALSALPDAINWLRAHKDDPAEVAKFNKAYNGTASYFLTGKLDPYAGLK